MKVVYSCVMLSVLILYNLKLAIGTLYPKRMTFLAKVRKQLMWNANSYSRSLRYLEHLENELEVYILYFI